MTATKGFVVPAGGGKHFDSPTPGRSVDPNAGACQSIGRGRPKRGTTDRWALRNRYFFVWAAYNSLRHHDGHGPSRFNEREHFFRNAGIVADIGPFGEPTLKVCDVDILSRKVSTRRLRCASRGE